LRAYRNAVLDFLKCFPEYQLSLIPRGQNVFIDALATSASTYMMKFHPNRKYEVEVKPRLDVPDNVRYRQVFGSDEKIESFFQLKEDFENVHIDADNYVDDDIYEIM